MHQDYKDLLAALERESVHYLIVGGHAVALHTAPRETDDLDILIGSDAPNIAALFRALAQIGAPLGRYTPEEFAEPGSFLRLGRPPALVDLLPQIAGVDFDVAWHRRVEATIDLSSFQQANFIGAEDLIAAKSAAGRPQDLEDVAALRRAQEPTQVAKGKPTRMPAKPPPGARRR